MCRAVLSPQIQSKNSCYSTRYAIIFLLYFISLSSQKVKANELGLFRDNFTLKGVILNKLTIGIAQLAALLSYGQFMVWFLM